MRRKSKRIQYKLLRILVLALWLGILAVLTTQFAAAQPANPNCWGVVTSQRAVAVSDIGEHASSQDEPRLGTGNVARLLFELGLSKGQHVC